MCEPNKQSQQKIIKACQFYMSNRAKLHQFLTSVKTQVATTEELIAANKDDNVYRFSELNKVLEKSFLELEENKVLSVVFLGKCNVGKSSIINQLLRDVSGQNENYVLLPIAETACNARVTTVCAGDNLSAQILDPLTKEILQDVPYDNSPQSGDIINLERLQRLDRDTISKHIRILSPHPVLAAGLQIIDCPGFGETDIMNQVILDFLKSQKPVVIVYVIDGKDGYKQNPDHENLCYITQKLSTFPCLICVNKLEFDEKAASMNDDSSDEEENEEDRQKRMLEMGEKLVKDQKESVLKNLYKYHSLDNEFCQKYLVPMSAKTVKYHSQSNQIKDVDLLNSFLEFESKIASNILFSSELMVKKVYEEFNYHLSMIIRVMTAFVESQREPNSKSGLNMVKVLASKISDTIINSLKSFQIEEVFLSLTEEGSELSRLSKNLVHHDRIEVSSEDPVSQREEERHLIDDLFKLCTSNAEKVIIKYLCFAKDALAQRCANHLSWCFKLTFEVDLAMTLKKLRVEYKIAFKNLVNSLRDDNNSFADEMQQCMNWIIDCMLVDHHDLIRICLLHFHDEFRQSLKYLVTEDTEFRNLVARSSKSVLEKETLIPTFLGHLDIKSIIGAILKVLQDKVIVQKEAIDTLYDTYAHNLDEVVVRKEQKLDVVLKNRDFIQKLCFVIQGLLEEVKFSVIFNFDSKNYIVPYNKQEAGTFSDKIVTVYSRDKSKSIQLKIRRQLLFDVPDDLIKTVMQLLFKMKELIVKYNYGSPSMFWFSDTYSLYTCVEDRYQTLETLLLLSDITSLKQRLKLCKSLVKVLNYLQGVNYAHGDLRPSSILCVEVKEGEDYQCIVDPGYSPSPKKFIRRQINKEVIEEVPNFFCHFDCLKDTETAVTPTHLHDLYSCGVLMWVVMTFSYGVPLPSSLIHVSTDQDLVKVVDKDYWLATTDNTDMDEIIKSCLTTSSYSCSLVQDLEEKLTQLILSCN